MDRVTHNDGQRREVTVTDEELRAGESPEAKKAIVAAEQGMKDAVRSEVLTDEEV